MATEPLVPKVLVATSYGYDVSFDRIDEAGSNGYSNVLMVTSRLGRPMIKLKVRLNGSDSIEFRVLAAKFGFDWEEVIVDYPVNSDGTETVIFETDEIDAFDYIVIHMVSETGGTGATLDATLFNRSPIGV